MNHIELAASVEELLGFRIQERENDAVLIRGNLKTSPQGLSGSRSVRPATREEVLMYLRLLGLVSTLNDQTSAMTELQAESTVFKMGEALQAADARIKELMAANKGLAEEREFLAEVHRARLTLLQEKHDAGLIAAAERMQNEWLKKFEVLTAEESQRHQDLESELRSTRYVLEGAEEAKASAEEMASQMNMALSDAQLKITELKAEVANLEQAVLRAESATCDVHGNEEEQS